MVALAPQQPVGLVMSGGQGSNAMLQIAQKLDTQRVCSCGKNEKLAARLRSLARSKPMFVEGFTKQVRYYMRVADFFLAKPGPGSISEALAMKLPVMVERNAWTLPQERYNAEWIREKQVGVVLKSFRDINAGLRELFDPENSARFRANAAAITNRAVFEIPDILDSIMQRESRSDR